MKKIIKWKDIKRGNNKPLFVIARWKNIGVDVNGGKIHSLDCFQYSDDTYSYDHETVTNEEAEERNKDKQRFTLDELNNIWHATPMARCARREIIPSWEFENPKCSCGVDACGGGVHADYCDKSKYN